MTTERKAELRAASSRGMRCSIPAAADMTECLDALDAAEFKLKEIQEYSKDCTCKHGKLIHKIASESLSDPCKLYDYNINAQNRF